MTPGGTMLGIVAIYLLITITQIAADPWRNDGRCGINHPDSNGNPGQCDPRANENEKGPCCSPGGWCGNSAAHCDCSNCVNYAGPFSPCDDDHRHCEDWARKGNCENPTFERYMLKNCKKSCGLCVPWLKQRYLGLKNDGSDEYKNSVKELLPILLKFDGLDGNEVGVAYIVNHKDTVHSLLKGQDILLKKTNNESVTINGTVNSHVNAKRGYSWMTERPTGLHAAPGDIVTITIPEQWVGKLGVHIGHRAYEGFKISFSLEKSVEKIASPWGGPIILDINPNPWGPSAWGDPPTTFEKNAIKGEFIIKVDQATRAPSFVYGKDTNELWNKEIKKYAPKWASLRVPGQVDIWVQTLKIKNITDMEDTMANIKETMDVLEAMLGLPPNSQPGFEYLILSPWYGMGGYHVQTCSGGGPAVGADMFYTDKTPIDTTHSLFHSYDDFFSINPDQPGKGTNGLVLHEMGHGFCYNDLPGSGGQWMAELIKEYVYRTRGSPLVSRESKFDDPFNVLYRMVSFSKFSNGKACKDSDFSEQSKPSYNVGGYDACFAYLYRLPLFEFGWNIFKEVVSMDGNSEKWYSSETDRMADLYCTATKSNLIPLFNFYNIEVSESVAEPCKKQKMPVLITKYIEIANCIRNEDITKCTEIPGFPEHKGICTFDGTCSTNPDYMDTIEMSNEFDLWGGTNDTTYKRGYRNTAQVEANCLGRAGEMFEWCGNSDKPITATFTSKDGISKSTFPPEGNCYSDWPRLLPKYKGSSSDMTPIVCKEKCKEEYAYSGVQNYNECWCGKDAPPPRKKLNMEKCDQMCRGDKNQPCGGRYKINIIKV